MAAAPGRAHRRGLARRPVRGGGVAGAGPGGVPAVLDRGVPVMDSGVVGGDFCETRPKLSSPIMPLFHGCCPTAIIRAIRAVVVETINAMVRRWTRLHILDEVLDDMPAMAHPDAPSSIIRVFVIPLLVTPGHHRRPYLVERMTRKPVDNRMAHWQCNHWIPMPSDPRSVHITKTSRVRWLVASSDRAANGKMPCPSRLPCNACCSAPLSFVHPAPSLFTGFAEGHRDD